MHTSLLALAGTLALALSASAQQHVIVTGVAPHRPPGRVPARRNLNDIYNIGGPQWDLYIQAVAAMQAKSQDDKRGWFALSVIHGLPFLEYDGSGERKSGKGSWGGYCPHGESIFLPWHRPYVLLFEQEMVRIAEEIAAKYPGGVRRRYLAAAASLRSPYWDWAADSAVPPATVPLQVTVNTPTGQQTIDNPLQTYKFPKELIDGAYGKFDFDKRPQIYRCRSPFTYPDSANKSLEERNLKTNIYATFTHSKTYDEFAITGNNGVGLETVHNWIHGDAACGEQLMHLSLAAFDPLFFLHHTNVDRLWAYWQAIHPSESLYNDSYRGGARWSVPEDSRITPDSELQPFWRTDAAFYTARQGATLEGKGYTYDGLAFWAMSAEEMKRSATAKINSLYGPETSKRRSGKERRTLEERTTTQYFIRVEANRADIARPSSIEVFIAGNKAGDLTVMELPTSGSLVSGFSIDEVIRDALGGNGTVSDVAGRQVEIAITQPDGTRLLAGAIESLKLAIHEVTVTAPLSLDEFPEVGEPNIYQVRTFERDGPKYDDGKKE